MYHRGSRRITHPFIIIIIIITHRQTDRQTGRQADRQTGRQIAYACPRRHRYPDKCGRHSAVNHGSDGRQVALVGRPRPQHVPLVCRCLGQGEGAPQVRLATKTVHRHWAGYDGRLPCVHAQLSLLGRVKLHPPARSAECSSTRFERPDGFFLADLPELKELLLPERKIEIKEEVVSTLLKGINVNKYSGPDGTDVRTLKFCADQFSGVLLHLFHTSIDQQFVPSL